MNVDIPERLDEPLSCLARHGLYGEAVEDIVEYALTRFLDDLARSKALRVALLVATGEAPAQPSERQIRKNGWSEDEDRVLRENYVTFATPGCAPFLPHRSHLAIRVRARKLGLATPRAKIALGEQQAGSPLKKPPPLPTLERIWCSQCEQRVVGPCNSQFCKIP